MRAIYLDVFPSSPSPLLSRTENSVRVADKNLKIVRTHRSSYFRLATRRGGRGRGRESARRLMVVVQWRERSCSPCFTAFGLTDLSGFKDASIRLRSRQNPQVFRLPPGRRKDLSQWRPASGLMASRNYAINRDYPSDWMPSFQPDFFLPRRRKFTVVVLGCRY